MAGARPIIQLKTSHVLPRTALLLLFIITDPTLLTTTCLLASSCPPVRSIAPDRWSSGTPRIAHLMPLRH